MSDHLPRRRAKTGHYCHPAKARCWQLLVQPTHQKSPPLKKVQLQKADVHEILVMFC